jgi:hypothetical protein
MCKQSLRCASSAAWVDAVYFFRSGLPGVTLRCDRSRQTVGQKKKDSYRLGVICSLNDQSQFELMCCAKGGVVFFIQLFELASWLQLQKLI